MTFLLLTTAVMGAAMLALGVGTLLGDRCLRGSCGGPQLLGPVGEPLGCEACPRRREGSSRTVGATGRVEP